MLHFLLAIHFVLTISIIGLILLQKHDSDGALGSSGGGAASGMFSVRGQANLLTRATAILMTVFICNCLVMAKLTKSTAVVNESIIDKVVKIEEKQNSVPVNPVSVTPGFDKFNDAKSKVKDKNNLKAAVNNVKSIAHSKNKVKDAVNIKHKK